MFSSPGLPHVSHGGAQTPHPLESRGRPRRTQPKPPHEVDQWCKSRDRVFVSLVKILDDLFRCFLYRPNSFLIKLYVRTVLVNILPLCSVGCLYKKKYQVQQVWYCSHHCCGSITFWCGSGYRSADPCPWLMDPDADPGSGSCYFRRWPRCQQKTNFLLKFYLLITFWRYIYIIFQRCEKESQNSRNQGFSYYFCTMIQGSGSGRNWFSLTLSLIQILILPFNLFWIHSTA